MTTPADELMSRLNQIEARLSRLEAAMNAREAPREPSTTQWARHAPPTAPSTPPGVDAGPAVLGAAREMPQPVQHRAIAHAVLFVDPTPPASFRPVDHVANDRTLAPIAGVQLATSAAGTTGTTGTATRPAGEPDPDADLRPDLERIIGGRWYAVIGALVVIVGVAFFYQYAVQQGWFRYIPHWVKCALGGAFGAALLATAEIIRKRINPWAAAGLCAAGVGSMYVSAYAAYARYGLVDAPAAFVLLTLCAGIGIAFGLRARLAAVAIVSILGGYLTPILLHDGGRAYVLPPYWIMLLVVGMTLSGRMGGTFTALRWITWWGTVIFGSFWIGGEGGHYPLLAIAFLVTTWATIHGELWISGVRHGPAAVDDQSSPEMGPQWRTWGPVLSSFGITAWTVGMGVIHARSWGGIPDWLPPAGGTAITALIALVLVGNLRGLRDLPRTAGERLGAALTTQAGALLIAAIALALTGWLEVVAWLGMGVAAMLTGRWIRSQAVAVYGGVLLAIASARLIAYDGTVASLTRGDLVVGLVASPWMLLMVMAALAWLMVGIVLAGWPRRSGDERQDQVQLIGSHTDIEPPLPAIATGIGIAMLMASCLNTRASGASIAIAWMLVAGAAMACASLAPRLRLHIHSAWVVLAAILPWSVAFIMPGWSKIHLTDPPGLHRGLIIALLLAGEIAIVARLLARRIAGDGADPDAPTVGSRIRTVGASLAALLVFTATSFEAARIAGLMFADRTAQLAAVSIWWGLFALALLAFGFLRRAEFARRTGLGLLGIATAKALLLDTAQVSLGWRVISVLGLGLLMLGVGVVYARLTKHPQPA